MAGGKKGGPNQKVVDAMAKKAEVEARKQAENDRKKEAAEAQEWAKGANARKASRDEELAAKADEAARKKREKAELLAAEEATLGSGGKSKLPAGPKKGKGKPKNDLALLEDALVKGADKKVRKQKEDEKKRVEEEKKRMEEKARKEAEAPLDPLLANTEAMLEGAGGREANVASMEEGAASGIDAALGSLGISGVGKPAKNLYKDFEAAMLPQIKEEFPGLRLSQQKEKVFALWKKSPENPQNQI
ncbi:hypothetical protein FisN_16Hh218 [Fistulifera solaris]|uniref:HMG box domain-containing protein n=1 Tax=Fistulifera solaris TaxID=1519565 RepID=A0A1Z5KT49_FISSO|nr:hypothetical protein FisN_16Hh218 [Fistulifera solaris]|eukprot:GAX29347.1 hypothetical protein FisN_16Hh218 [Fistulifera solaris]